MLDEMRCQECGGEIGDAFFAAWEKTAQAKNGRFECPSCRADHVRRGIGTSPEGKPLYSIRLWGHPTTKKRKKEGPGSR